VIERNIARSFLESKSWYQISLWFKSVGSHPLCCASCLALSSWFTWEQVLNTPETVDPHLGK